MTTYPIWAEQTQRMGIQARPSGFKSQSVDLAIPDVLRPTAVYAPGVDIPPQSADDYGAYLLSSVGQFFGHYSRYQNVSDLWTVTLWAFMTHIRNPSTHRPLVPMIPRIMFLGESGCGKSTDLQLLRLVCARATKLKVEPTEPAVRSMLGSEDLTLLLDEAEILVGNGNRKANIRAILNASAYPDGSVDRIQGGRRVEEPVYGPAAIAALPYLEVATGGVLDTLVNRSHKIYKKKPSEAIPQILEEPQGQELGRAACRLAEEWVQANLREIVERIPKVRLPEGLDPHRDSQKWRAMFAIAEQAGGMWPAYASHAALGVKDSNSLTDFRARLGSLGR